MPILFITARDGAEQIINAESGVSVMEAVRSAGLDEMLALCGGCCSCATCHVYVDSDFTGMLPAMGADEDALLDSSEHRIAESRLACQIRVHDELDGFRARIAPED